MFWGWIFYGDFFMALEKFSAVIIAAGEGRRMKSSLPKVMHRLGGLPMIGHVINHLRAARCAEIVLVLAPTMDEVAAFARELMPDIQIAYQKKPRGTADALAAGLPKLKQNLQSVIVAYGDTPLISPQTYKKLAQRKADISICGFTPNDPKGYGRIFCERGVPMSIVEDDGSPVKSNNLCNAGVMGFAAKNLPALLAQIGTDNPKGERYLTDVVKLAHRAGRTRQLIQCDETEAFGINSPGDLAHLERLYQNQLRNKALASGVHLTAPETIYFSWDTSIAPGVIVEPYVVFGTGVKISQGAHVKSFSHIEGAAIKDNAIIGPYARLRPGAQIGADVHIGNFVEVKQTKIDKGAKANHLAYLGDAHIGANANIGAGTITCNYDGEQKHLTQIGADAFIGSNSALVAPVKIGKGAYVGSGSTITDDVKAGALALGRARQVEKPARTKKQSAKKKSKRKKK